MTIRARSWTLRAVALVATATSVAALTGQAAGADDEPPPPEVPITFEIQTLATVPASITVQPVSGQVIEMSGLVLRDVATQCFDSLNGKVCLGDIATAPIQIENEATTSRMVIESRPAAALQWMAEEGARAVALLYDVPSDERVMLHARDEIRSYMVERILGIIDKAAYGHTLTADEQRALTYVQDEVLGLDRILARATYDEYQRFKAEGCGYAPPTAPSFVAQPVGLPDAVRSWCLSRTPGFAAVFASPMPSVAEFQAWGFYRVADDLHLDALNTPAFQENMFHVARAGTLGAGLVVAAGAAAVTAAAVGANSALAATIGGIIAPYAVRAGVAAGFGVGSSAAIVAVVVLALVAAALSIWQLVEHAQIASTITNRMNATAAATDPFGLAALRTANAGRSLGADRATWIDEASRPLHRREAAYLQLTELVTRVTMVRPGGAVREDPTDLWTPNATTAADHRFRVTAADGTVSFVDEINVPTAGGGTATVRFNGGWMVVSEGGGPATPALNVGYLDEDGQEARATRRPDPDGEGQVFTITTAAGDGTVDTVLSDALTYRDASGGLVTARIVPPADTLSGGPRPSVAGRLLPGHTHSLSPNPVDAAGNLGGGTFADDYDYEWTLERQDEATGEWVPTAPLTPVQVAGNESYGARFTPTVVGQYRAQVTMVHRDGAAPNTAGVVEFAVEPPEVELLHLELRDDHFDNELELSLQVREQVPGDEVTVSVQWPGELGSDAPGPVTETGATCLSGTPCATPFVIVKHPTGVTTDLRGHVTVTVTNSHGGALSRTVPIATPARPSFTEPPVPPSPDQPGVVSFDGYVTHVQLPVVTGANPNYVVAGIEPGESSDPDPTFMITDPSDPGPPLVAVDVRGDGTFLISMGEHEGQPVVVVRGVPRAEDIGTYEVPLLVQQSNGARSTLVLLLDVVAAPDDEFRAAMFSDVDPLDFGVDRPPEISLALLGGRSEWGPYDGEVCVSLADGAGQAEVCDDVGAFFAPDGTSLPFPYSRLVPGGLHHGEGTVRARAWLPAGDRTYPEPMEVSFILTGDDYVPTAVAGPGQVVNRGDVVTLDGTGSTDPDGHDLTYSWEQVSGPDVVLTGATTAQPSFTAPAGPATLVFGLIVDDGRGGVDADQVTVTVNVPPTAVAGPGQVVNRGDVVTLDGAGSTDPDGDDLGYAWEQVSGPDVVLTGATTAQPSFTAPAGPATLVFGLTVDDGRGGVDADQVTITVENRPPAADAGADAEVVEATTATLVGAGHDPDGDTMTYAWAQVSGPPVTLMGADAATATFTVPAAPATLVFRLTVDDGRGLTASDEVAITSRSRFTPDEAFVDHTFRVLLGRPSDPGGRAYWVGRLAAGVSRTGVAEQLGLSAEATRGRVLDQRFRAWLGRTADAGARDHWAPRLLAGQPILSLEVSVLASDELHRRAGGTDAAYVTALYDLLLGRSPTGSERSFWQGRVVARGRTVVAVDILTSTEAGRRRVATAYPEVLGRAADPGGLAYWTGVLGVTGDLRRVEVALAAAWVNRPGAST